MHSEYLRRLFLNNDLFAGRYKIDGKAIALSDIHAPMFVVGTETDHIAPWLSVYKINLVADTEVTFVLTGMGHNMGIVSPPGVSGRRYRLSRRKRGDNYVDPQTWFTATPSTDGSWWLAFAAWLAGKSEGETAPPAIGAPEKGYPPLGPAPGKYIFEK
jgi:polyhydroxyalkanoate synthase